MGSSSQQKLDNRQIGRKVAKNSAVGMVAVAIYFVSRLALTPFILHYVDLAEFGLWSMCFVILSYAGLGAIGVDGAYIKYTAEYHSRRDQDAIASLLSTGIVCMISFCLFFYTALYLILPAILGWFHVSSELMDVAVFMILGTALAYCLDFTLGGFRATLEGLQEIAMSKTVNVTASLFEVAMVLIFLPLGMGVKGLLYAFIIKTLAEMVACTGLVFKKLPGLKLGWGRISKQSFRALFVFGGKIQILGILAIVLASLDRIVITGLLGLKATGLFEIGRKFPFTGRNISRAAFGPLLPAASHMGGFWERGEAIPSAARARKYMGLVIGSATLAVLPATGWIGAISEKWMPGSSMPGYGFISIVMAFLLICLVKVKPFYKNLISEDRLIGADLRDLYIKGFRHVNLINVTIFTFLMATARPLIIGWVGVDYLPAVSVLVIVSLANIFHQGTGPASVIVRGINRVGRELECLIIQFVLAIVWIPAGTLILGITGAALGILASAVLSSAYFLWRTNHAFRIPWRESFHATIMPALAPAASAAVVYALTLAMPTTNRWTCAFLVAFLGCLHLGLTFGLLWKLFLSDREMETVASMFTRFKPFNARK